jgi:hypothetical protein
MMRPNRTRHELAIEQTTQWAHDAAQDGDYVEALSWLRALEVVEGSLSPKLQLLRRRCLIAFEQEMLRAAGRSSV